MHFFRMISLILLGLHGTHALPAQRLASRQSSPESGPQRWMDWFQQVSAWTLRHQGEILVAAGTLGSALLAKKVLIWQLTREGNSKLTWDLEISPENRLKMREEIMRSLARKNLPPEFVDCFAVRTSLFHRKTLLFESRHDTISVADNDVDLKLTVAGNSFSFLLILLVLMGVWM